MDLKTFFKEHSKVALGFSGGVDSAYLLYTGKLYGADIKAYFIKSQFQPKFELEDALTLAKNIGVNIKVIELDALQDENVKRNYEDRCYFCKKQIFERLTSEAKRDGYFEIIDGTNASDDEGDRPGMKALKEMKVLSPLRTCGLSKNMIRELSHEAGLFTWDKPSYACLATRVSCKTPISQDILERIEKAEAFLMEIGFSDFRVRTDGNAAKLQFKPKQIQLAFDRRNKIKKGLEPYFDDILLDLKER